MTNSYKKKVSAGILIIGNEILSGRTQDLNISFLCDWLNKKCGITVEEVRVVPDIEQRIVKNVTELKKKFKYIFTTGGIGPTHDDITSESISDAFNQEYCFHKEAYKILEEYYPSGKFNEGRKKMAKMPKNVKLILNPLSAAPGFIINNIYVLPGVPDIMEKMFSSILQIIKKGSPKKTLTLNTNLFESTIAQGLEIIQLKFSECSIGSYPFYNYISKTGGVNIVISSWSIKNLDHIVKEIQEMITLLGGKSSIV